MQEGLYPTEEAPVEWNPDDILLTIEAHHLIAREPTRRGSIIEDLAAELHREISATEAAVQAVGTNPLQANFAGAMISALRANEAETSRLARAARNLRLDPKS